MSKYIEIGSEFEMPCEGLNPTDTKFEEYVLTYSGRTSIHLAIQDLLTQKAINKVWLPSYCCSSMIQSFQDFNIPICFYTVNGSRTGGVIREKFFPKVHDIVVSMSYFGFSDCDNEALIDLCVSKGISVIEDCTHSFLSLINYHDADYAIASIRKWFPLASGGVVKKKNNKMFCVLQKPNEYIIKEKRMAMQEKADYLNSSEIGPETKTRFLGKFEMFNQNLFREYKNLEIDPWSRSVLKKQNIDAIRCRRRKNATILLDGLSKLCGIRPLFSSLGENDCPLFIPVVSEKRNYLKKWLADQKIYCPAHWPKPCIEANTDLYDTELSLICDQRYNDEDMARILEVLTKFSKDN